MRIDLESGEGQAPKVTSEQVVAEGIPWVNSPEALVLGPTGLALASNGTLYVASTQNNKILAVSEAATRTTAAKNGGTVLTAGGHLKEPLGMVLAPNGNLITTNGGDGNMVETTPAGQQVAVQTADKKTGAGSLFGLATSPGGNAIYYVDDGENTLNLLHAPRDCGSRLRSGRRRKAESRSQPRRPAEVRHDRAHREGGQRLDRLHEHGAARPQRDRGLRLGRGRRRDADVPRRGKDARAEPQSRRLQVLLLGAGPPDGRHGRHADRQMMELRGPR